MGDCEKNIENISALADGELTDSEKSDASGHIASCPDCRRVYDAFTGISEAVRTDTEPVPEGLSRGVMYAVGKGRTRPKTFTFGRFTALAACLAVILFCGAKYGWFDFLSPNTSSSSALYAAGSSESPASGGEDAAMENSQLTAGAETSGSLSPADPSVAETVGSKFAAGNISVYDGDSQYDVMLFENADGAELEKLLAAAGTDASVAELVSEQDYTVVFSDGSTLGVWYLDGAVYCRAPGGAVYLASCTPDDLEGYLAKQTQ